MERKEALTQARELIKFLRMHDYVAIFQPFCCEGKLAEAIYSAYWQGYGEGKDQQMRDNEDQK